MEKIISEFDKKDIEVLDYIIDEIIKRDLGILFNNVRESSYFYLKEGGFEPNNYKGEQIKEFVRVLGIIDKYNCAKCEFKDIRIPDSENHIKRSENTITFKANGGFKKVYKDNIDWRKRQRRIKRKEATDLWIASKTKKTFWFVLVTGFIGGIYTFINNVVNEKNDSKQLEQIQQSIQENKEQVKELRTLIVSQKKDSL